MNAPRRSVPFVVATSVAFVGLNLASIWLYLVLVDLVRGLPLHVAWWKPLRPLVLILPFVAAEAWFFLRARTWKGAIGVLYLGMLAAILATTAGFGAPLVIVFGHVLGLPGLGLVVAANWLAYAKLGLPGASQLRRRPGGYWASAADAGP